jgi:predicted porin
MSSPYKMATVKWDPFLSTSAQARGNGGASVLHNGYVDNALAYANKFGMANVTLAYVFDEETIYVGQDVDSPTYRNEDHMSASVNMPVGPVEVALGYFANGVADSTATKVGVKYTAGAIGASFTYESLEAGVASTFNGSDNTVMLLSGTYAMGANTFALNYGTTDADKSATAKANTITNMSVGMVHGFSKNTSAHVAYTSVDNDNANVTVSGIAAGLRVKF